MVFKFFDKRTSLGAATLTRSETLATRATRSESAVKNENISRIRKSKLENNTNQLLENSR